jgi:hypothetical protein
MRMRVPLVRFGSDNRPIEPWEERFAPIVVPVILLLSFALVVGMAALAGVLFLGWAVVSPVLPRSWRLTWDTAFDLDPSVQAECPACQARLALGPVDKRGHVVPTQPGQQLVMPVQTAVCTQCHQVFNRFSLGKVWSSWQEAAADPGTAPDRGGS